MSELDTLKNLARETGLLAATGDVETMRHTSYQFTVKAAQRLRREGWALLRAPAGGNQINGVRIDKLINRSTLAIVDIIANADDPNGPPRQAAWQDEGHFGEPRDIVDAPIEIDQPPTTPELPPTTDHGDGLFADVLVAQIARLIDAVEELTRVAKALQVTGEKLVGFDVADLPSALRELDKRLEAIQREGVRVRLR